MSAAKEREGRTPSGSCRVVHGPKWSLGQNGSPQPFFFSLIFFLFCFSDLFHNFYIFVSNQFKPLSKIF
jgi:hypothetical protein